MAKKTYRTYHLKGLQILLFDDYGRPMEITFRSGCQIDSTAKFTTSDENLQKTLEASSGFGRDFYVESVREEKAAPDASPVAEDGDDGLNEANGQTDEAEDNKTLQVEVADKSDAIEWLKEHNPEAGYTAAKLRSKEAFENACRDNNVEFIFS